MIKQTPQKTGSDDGLMIDKLAEIKKALIIATGYTGLVADGTVKAPILRTRAQSDCNVLSDALRAVEVLQQEQSARPVVDVEKLKGDLDFFTINGASPGQRMAVRVSSMFLLVNSNPVDISRRGGCQHIGIRNRTLFIN